jgi:hypothetical protein
MGSYQSSTTHSTTVTPPQSSVVEEENNKHQKPPDQQPDWLQSSEPYTTQTGNSSNNIPMLGLINSFASDDASNSFSGSTDQFQSAEERMHLEEDLLELQEIQGQCKQYNDETTKQRKGMVRREFNRRIMRFKKKKNKGNHKDNNNNNNNAEISSENNNDDDDDDDGTDASGNKIIIKLKIDDDNVNTPEPTRHPFKMKGGKPHKPHYAPFGVRKHNRSHSLQMILGQENGC